MVRKKTHRKNPLELPEFNDGSSSKIFDPIKFYFKDLSSFPVLNLKEERVLTKKVRDHALACVRTIIALLTVATDIVKAGKSGNKFFSVKNYQTFGKRVEKVSKDGRKRRKEVIEAAEVFTEEFNPKGLSLKGETLKKKVFKKITSRSLANYLLEFMPPKANADLDELISRNLKLVITIARRFHGLPMMDMIQNGNEGLIKAVARFDHRKGFRFSTYATWWIRHGIGRAVADSSRTVRVPVHQHDLDIKLSKATKSLIGSLGREPTNEEVAEAAEVSVERIRSKHRYLHHPVSIDQPITGPDGVENSTLGEVLLIEQDDVSNPVVKINSEQTKAFVRESLLTLTALEQDIIESRFGLENDEGETFREIGERYKLSRERIRQIQAKALGKLKKKLSTMGVRP